MMTKHSALLVALLAALLATPWIAAAQQSEATERSDQLLTAFIASFNDDLARGRIENWLEVWADDAERILPTAAQFGKAEIRMAYQNLYQEFSNPKLIEKHRSVQGATGAWEGLFTAIHKTSESQVRLPLAIFLTFNTAGKVQSAHAYFDAQ